MTLGMQRIQEHRENGIKLKKNWNGNKNMKPWFLILNFLDFNKQNYIDFIRKLDWFPYKPEHLWNVFTRPFLNLPTTTYCHVKLVLGMGWGKNFKTNLRPTSTHFDAIMVPLAGPYMSFLAVWICFLLFITTSYLELVPCSSQFMKNILIVYFANSTKSSCNILFNLTTHWKTTAVKVIWDETNKQTKEKTRKALCWSVNVFSTRVLIGDTKSHTGNGTAILRGHPSYERRSSHFQQGKGRTLISQSF